MHTRTLCFVLLLTPTALAEGDVVDSRITFVLGDDNLLAGSEDRSPSLDIGERSDIKTFFDNYNTKDSGQETKTNFAFYRAFGGPFPRIVTEAGLVVRMDFFLAELNRLPGMQLADDGTFLQASYLLGDVKKLDAGDGPTPAQTPRIYLLAFPFNADRMRLGYSYDITWGGNPVFPNRSRGAPGFKLGWERKDAYAFVGLKTTPFLSDRRDDLSTLYGVLAGGGYDFGERLRWEVNGGYFQRGEYRPFNVQEEDDPLKDEQMEAIGVSSQVTYHVGMPIETSVDLRLYRNDPRFPWRAFREEKHADDWWYMAAAEGTFIRQTLRHPKVYGSNKVQNAFAGDVNLRLKRGYLRFTADFVYRNLAFVVLNTPSMTPGVAWPNKSLTTPEWFVSGGVDYYFESLRVNTGIIAGYQHPATFRGDENVETVVVRSENERDILPFGQKSYDIISFRAFCRWDMTDGMSALTEVTYTLDKNATRLDRAEDGTFYRSFDRAEVQNRLALAFILQARF